MPQDVDNAGVPLSELGSADDPRATRVAAAAALRRRDLPAGERADLAAIEERRAALCSDTRPVELRAYPAPWQDDYGEAQASGGFRTVHDVAGQVADRISINPRPARFLYALVREFTPKRALEMGTGVGISGAYLATGLRHAGRGRMLALEGAPDLAALARETYAQLGLDMVDEVRIGPFAETLGDALHGEIDFAYIDGHHDGRATLEYFERLLPHAANALLVFDDVRWSKGGMREAWRAIANDERVSFAVNGKRVGLAFTGSPRRERTLPWRRAKRPSDLVAS
jgi:predicted O-methyltransferase YrrM